MPSLVGWFVGYFLSQRLHAMGGGGGVEVLAGQVGDGIELVECLPVVDTGHDDRVVECHGVFGWWFDGFWFRFDNGWALGRLGWLGSFVIRVLCDVGAGIFVGLIQLAFVSFDACFAALTACLASRGGSMDGQEHGRTKTKTRSTDQTQNFNDDRLNQQ